MSGGSSPGGSARRGALDAGSLRCDAGAGVGEDSVAGSRCVVRCGPGQKVTRVDHCSRASVAELPSLLSFLPQMYSAPVITFLANVYSTLIEP